MIVVSDPELCGSSDHEECSDEELLAEIDACWERFVNEECTDACHDSFQGTHPCSEPAFTNIATSRIGNAEDSRALLKDLALSRNLHCLSGLCLGHSFSQREITAATSGMVSLTARWESGEEIHEVSKLLRISQEALRDACAVAPTDRFQGEAEFIEQVKRLVRAVAFRVLSCGHLWSASQVSALFITLSTSPQTCQTFGYMLLDATLHWLYSQLSKRQQVDWISYGNLGLILSGLDYCSDALLQLRDRFVFGSHWTRIMNELQMLLKTKFVEKPFTSLRVFVWKLAIKLSKCAAE